MRLEAWSQARIRLFLRDVSEWHALLDNEPSFYKHSNPA